jgi:hypothetical protein
MPANINRPTLPCTMLALPSPKSLSGFSTFAKSDGVPLLGPCAGALFPSFSVPRPATLLLLLARAITVSGTRLGRQPRPRR